MTTDQTPSLHTAEDASKSRQVADILVAKYGSGAASVAARQLEEAEGEQKQIWASIAALLAADQDGG